MIIIWLNICQCGRPQAQCTFPYCAACLSCSKCPCGREFIQCIAPDCGGETMKERTYKLALELVKRIDYDCTHGTRHYRNKSGELLSTLEEVIQAILKDDLR